MYRFCLILFLVLPTSDCAFGSKLSDCHCDVDTSVVTSIVDYLKELKERLATIEKRQMLPMTCLEAGAGSFQSGIYEVLLKKYSDEPFEVFCDEGDYENAEGGGWTVIQRRVDDSVIFYRSWHDYQMGFGDLNGNYWIGLDKLHAFTTSCEHELYIVLQRFNRNNRLYAKYEKFVIGGEAQKYNLTVLGSYVGTAGDSLKQHKGSMFSTWDSDHDISDTNCAQKYMGGWWYYKCYYSNLNGDYKERAAKGIVWISIQANESLKFTQMMIRPTKNCIKRLQLRK